MQCRGEKSITHLWGGSPSRWWLTGPHWGIWVRRTEYITGTAAGSQKSVWIFTRALERENECSGKAPWGERGHLLFQLGLGQQLWDEVQTDVDGGDSCHSERKQGLRVTLGDEGAGTEQDTCDDFGFKLWQLLIYNTQFMYTTWRGCVCV